MKVMQLPDGTIQIINEVPQSLIDECERLCKDGRTRFIFDKKSEILRLLSETSPSIYKMIVREVKLEEIL